MLPDSYLAKRTNKIQASSYSYQVSYHYHSLLSLRLMSTLSIAYSCPLHGALGNTLVVRPDSAHHLTGLLGGQLVNLWQHPVSNTQTITILCMAFPPSHKYYRPSIAKPLGKFKYTTVS